MPHATTDAFPAEESTAERLAPLTSLPHGGNAQQLSGGAGHAAAAGQCACEPVGATSPAALR